MSRNNLFSADGGLIHLSHPSVWALSTAIKYTNCHRRQLPFEQALAICLVTRPFRTHEDNIHLNFAYLAELPKITAHGWMLYKDIIEAVYGQRELAFSRAGAWPSACYSRQLQTAVDWCLKSPYRQLIDPPRAFTHYALWWLVLATTSSLSGFYTPPTPWLLSNLPGRPRVIPKPTPPVLSQRRQLG